MLPLLHSSTRLPRPILWWLPERPVWTRRARSSVQKSRRPCRQRVFQCSAQWLSVLFLACSRRLQALSFSQRRAVPAGLTGILRWKTKSNWEGCSLARRFCRRRTLEDRLSMPLHPLSFGPRLRPNHGSLLSRRDGIWRAHFAIRRSQILCRWPVFQCSVPRLFSLFGLWSRRLRL